MAGADSTGSESGYDWGERMTFFNQDEIFKAVKEIALPNGFAVLNTQCPINMDAMLIPIVTFENGEQFLINFDYL
jgi:hypothetical protein